MIFLLTRNCRNSVQRQTKINSVSSTMHIGRTLTSTTVVIILYHRPELRYVINTSISTSRWCGLNDTWKITLQLRFRNNVELAQVLAETFKISVNIKYCSTVGELISEFPLPKLGGTCIIIDNICRFSLAITHFEVTDRCLTKNIEGSSFHDS
jgi:hypothetical protein